MLQLKDFRSQAKGLPDLLTYAALIEPGIILQKDGSFLAAWEIRGEDTASATPDELAYVSQQFSNAVARLGTGWMLHVDACRTRQRHIRMLPALIFRILFLRPSRTNAAPFLAKDCVTARPRS